MAHRRTAKTASRSQDLDNMASFTAAASPSTPRNPPYLPTPLETMAFAVFPCILVFGTVFSVVNADTRSAPYDAESQSHFQDPSLVPSYFARKSNIFNVIFVKRGWGWITFAFVFSLLMQPTGRTPPAVVAARRVRAGLRWAAVTGWWFFVTQWCFGPPIIDRSFRWTGGQCEVAEREVAKGETGVREMLTAVACKAAGGKWRGGHDISGHVFLMVLGTAFLMQEVGWSTLRWTGRRSEERCVVMPDGAVKSASIESETATGDGAGQIALGIGGKTAVGMILLNLWMLLMTAIYFHTWFEKLTGLLTAFLAVYAVYYIPRFVPGLRQILGLPGI